VQRNFGYQKININDMQNNGQQQQRTESRVLQEQRANMKANYPEGVPNVRLPDRAFSMSTRPNKKAE